MNSIWPFFENQKRQAAKLKCGISVTWRLRPRFRSCPSQIKQWTGVVEAHSMQLAHLYIYTLFNVSCSSCLSRNGIITNVQRNRRSETNPSLLGSGRTFFLKDCSKDICLTRQWPSLDPGGQKVVYRIHSTSRILRW